MSSTRAYARWAHWAFRAFSSQTASGELLATSSTPVWNLPHFLAQQQHGIPAALARSHLLRRAGLPRSFAEQAHRSSEKAARGGERQPVSLNALIVFLMAGAGVLYGVREYKDTKLQKVMTQSQQVVGQASVGGPFSLTDQDGKPFSDKDLLSEFALLYFGFTHCPDICPDELEKLAEALDLVEKWTGVQIQPVFISVDPERDKPELVKAYVKEFHPRLIGLTGDIDSIKKASKAYRVYYSKTGDSETDYLVDHSIIHYLISPTGEFVTFFSKSYTAEQMAKALVDNLATWQKDHPAYHKGKEIKAPPTAAAAGAAPGAK